MKTFLLFILALFLVLAVLGSCIFLNLSGSASQPPAVPILTATLWISTSEPTPMMMSTVSPDIYYDLNMAIQNMETSNKFNTLEHINGATYQITGVEFRWEDHSPVFQVKTRCECAENGPCCSPIRTFVVTIIAMDSYRTEINQMVQAVGPVNRMEVWCYDHAKLTEKMLLPWADVYNFLQGQEGTQGTTDGFRLWFEVTPIPIP